MKPNKRKAYDDQFSDVFVLDDIDDSDDVRSCNFQDVFQVTSSDDPTNLSSSIGSTSIYTNASDEFAENTSIDSNLTSSGTYSSENAQKYSIELDLVTKELFEDEKQLLESLVSHVCTFSGRLHDVKKHMWSSMLFHYLKSSDLKEASSLHIDFGCVLDSYNLFTDKVVVCPSSESSDADHANKPKKPYQLSEPGNIIRSIKKQVFDSLYLHLMQSTDAVYSSKHPHSFPPVKYNTFHQSACHATLYASNVESVDAVIEVILAPAQEAQVNHLGQFEYYRCVGQELNLRSLQLDFLDVKVRALERTTHVDNQHFHALKYHLVPTRRHIFTPCRDFEVVLSEARCLKNNKLDPHITYSVQMNLFNNDRLNHAKSLDRKGQTKALTEYVELIISNIHDLLYMACKSRTNKRLKF